MVQEYKNICIIGAGASGTLCAYFLLKAGLDVTIFDKGSPLRTILPTGGGRCNLAHEIYDFKELVSNYPRGEKFLYSVFSKFGTMDTINLFEELGIKTYTQDNGRIFPKSNSSKEVRKIILDNIKKANFIKEEVVDLFKIDSDYIVETSKAKYLFSHVIVAIGGHSGVDLLKKMDIKCVEQKPSLVGLTTKEDFKSISGLVVKNVKSSGFEDDILFTHFGISGPLIYKISSVRAFDKFPYVLSFDLNSDIRDLQKELEKNPHKTIKNLLSNFLPTNLVIYLLNDLSIELDKKCSQINGKTRDVILEKIHNFTVTIISTNRGEETVMAGGVDLAEINSKTMEAKRFSKLFFTGEILNIDGFCGGFNLQNAWSTAYIASEAIINN